MKPPPYFTVRQGDAANLEFERQWDARGPTDEIKDAHPEYCSQCIYSAAAEWFYLGWFSRKPEVV